MNRFRTIEFLLAFCLLTAVYTADILKTEFHVDESSWIGTSGVFEAYFKGEINSNAWDPTGWQSGKQNGKVFVPITTNSTISRFFIGLGRRLGGYDRTKLNKPWNFGKSTEENIAHGRKPIPNLLWWSRLPMSILAATGLFLAFLLLHGGIGRVAAYVWLTFCLTNDFFILTFRRAMDEGALLCSLLLIAFCGVKVLTNPPVLFHRGFWRTKQFYWLLALGVSIGICAGVKLNGLAMALTALIVIPASLYREEFSVRRKLQYLTLGVLLTGCVAYATFLLPNYYLLKNPISGIISMIEYRTWLMPIQVRFVPEHLRIGEGQIFELLYKNVFDRYAGIKNVPWFNCLLALGGLLITIRTACRWLTARDTSPVAFVLLAIFIPAVAPVLALHLDLDRYFILPVLFAVLFSAIAIGCLADHGARLINNRPQA